MAARKKSVFLLKNYHSNCRPIMHSFFLIFVAWQEIQTIHALSDPVTADLQSRSTVQPKSPRPNRNFDHMTDAQSDGSLAERVSSFEGATVDNITVPSQRIISSCAAFIEDFSDAAAAYTRCSILNSRPLHFCEKCVNVYVTVKESYDFIMKGEFHDDTGAKCSDAILNSDRIQIVVQTYKFVERIWHDCHCEECFTHDSTGYELNNETLHFFDLANQTSACFANFTHEIVPWSNDTVDPIVCESCQHVYDLMNEYYEHLLEENPDKVCMDIVDKMNLTRFAWSQIFHCTQRHVDIVPVVLLTVFFCTLPILFYAANKIHGTKVEKKLLKQKRMTESLVTTLEEEEIPS